MRTFATITATALTLLALPATASADRTGSFVIQPVSSAPTAISANKITIDVTASSDVCLPAIRPGEPPTYCEWSVYLTQDHSTRPCDLTNTFRGLEWGLPAITTTGTRTATVNVSAFFPRKVRFCLYSSGVGGISLLQETVIDLPAGYGKRATNCEHFASRATAQDYFWLYPHDPMGLDADNDGAACEHLPGSPNPWIPAEPLSTYKPPTTPEPAPIYAPELPPRPTRLAPATTDTPTQPKAKPVINRVKCGSRLLTKPRSCVKGNVKLTKLRWHSWGTTAKATGQVKRAGRKSYRATIKLSRLQSNIYTKLTA